ncbi:uncharacterized protein LOC124943095 [Impatiens glandulifera]|uniref:uncharacterized protein LOC124943095 n=1 Tax=Impatiens glandulifera TaxID=253017 RepID=UPI001FB07CEF|nr:uncharacterized protein LOC124943095 [Impatiens glandulifera]
MDTITEIEYLYIGHLHLQNLRPTFLIIVVTSTSIQLLGPPEVYQKRTESGDGDGAATHNNTFINLLVTKFNSTNPQLSKTENFSPTFLSTGNPCLDFFFHVVPDTPSAILTQRLASAWEHNPSTAFKLVCNLRGVRGTGKSDKESYYTAALWIHENHPKTLACNVESLANFGYFKDLPEILFRLLQGSDVRRIAKEQHISRKLTRRPRKPVPKTKKKAESFTRQNARTLRVEKRIATAIKAIERYNRDPHYRFLHDRISDLFAECLKTDIKNLKSDSINNLSLAAKWCPSLDSSFDKSTLLCESIARRVFPKSNHPEYDGLEDAHYAFRVRDRLRKEILVPLRRALELPEVYIGANQWGSIPYNRVASVAMKLYKEKFLKHDNQRFKEYLEKVKTGKAKIAAGALLPHEIISSLNNYSSDGGQVAELQWKRMVDDISKKGKMKNCLPICDVSGSMYGIPMEVSTALGLLVSELSDEPWKGKVITFSENPELQVIKGDGLRSKVKFVQRMKWGMNTDFQKVFDLILEVAVNGNLKGEDMIKRVIVFSDMEFDQASANPWETDYEVILRKFLENGYGKNVPEIVFWNLRDSKATPVFGNQKGVALVSGFSKNLMSLFIEEDGELDPENVMLAAISGDEYGKLVVID